MDGIGLFQDDKDTKFESNSQRIANGPFDGPCCFRMTKIQSLRAIHNEPVVARLWEEVVSG